MEPSQLLIMLRELIKRYCMKNKIMTISSFAMLARVDRDTISDICNKAHYSPSWRVVAAIAVAVDMPVTEIKGVLGPLYDQSSMSARRTTAHQAIARKNAVDVSTAQLPPLHRRMG